jgi:hypothetical protein
MSREFGAYRCLAHLLLRVSLSIYAIFLNLVSIYPILAQALRQ